jgi:uncharacterized protein (TIGR02145 family)
MKKLVFIIFPVFILTYQVKPQDIGNPSSFVNSGIGRTGNVSENVPISYTGESAYAGNITNLSSGTATQNETTSTTNTETYEPVIFVESEMLHQYGNYLLTCAPPLTYRVHGRYLTDNLLVFDHYDGSAYVSLTGEVNDYVSVLSIVPVNGVVDTTIYVRHCPDFYDIHTYINNISSGVGVSLLVVTEPIAGNAPVTTLGHVQGEPGTVIRVPVKVTGFDYIFGIHYVIEFDPTVLTYQDLESYFVWFTEPSVVQISPKLSQLIIDIECPSDVFMSAPDNEKILDLLFAYNSGSTNLTFGDCSFQNIFWFYPNDEPASEYYNNGSVSSSVKSTSVYLNLEGLYDLNLGKLNKAMGETEAYFGDAVADQVAIKLASESAAYSTVFELDSVEVDQEGHCRFNVPAIYTGNYYVAVSHRNSIETWSDIPVSFNDSVVNYDFTTSASQAYGNNLKSMGDIFGLYAGDVNQDGIVDTGDMTPIDNQASEYATGYLSADVNGDGMIDTWDMTFVDNNAMNMIGKIIPSSDSLPVIMTDSITDITIVSAVCRGSVLQQGGSQLTAQGVCWDTSPEPTISDSHTIESGQPGIFESNVTGLIPNTLYYIRAYATNNYGTAYGNEMCFNSAIFSPGGGVTDYDGHQYSTVVIGYQEWMAENLNVTHYRNGDQIPNVTDNTAWSNLTTGAFCWYNNDEIGYSDLYGALYNWYAVTDNRGLCPSGWRVPSDSDWAELITNYLGGLHIAGFKMKSTSGWNNNTNGNNISGFTGLPGGMRYYHPYYLSFISLGVAAGWWSSTEQHISTAMYRYIAYPVSNFKQNGYSVRCLKE